MKTPLSYYGGKARIASQIVPHIIAIPHTVYAEPFFGGGAVLFAKGRKYVTHNDHYKEAINDKNELLITFWRVARNKPNELAQYLSLTPYSHAEYRKSKEIYNNPNNYSDLEIAWAVYTNLNMAFSHQINNGWSTSTITNRASAWTNKLIQLPECFTRLQDIHIGCEDALDFIKRWDSPQTVIYADPPYPEANQGHYAGYTIDDWAKLCDTLDNCQSSYVLSNYDQPIIPQSAQKVIEINAVMSATNHKAMKNKIDKARIEKLWICDRSENIKSDLKRILGIGRVKQFSLL